MGQLQPGDGDDFYFGRGAVLVQLRLLHHPNAATEPGRPTWVKTQGILVPTDVPCFSCGELLKEALGGYVARSLEAAAVGERYLCEVVPETHRALICEGCDIGLYPLKEPGE